MKYEYGTEYIFMSMKHRSWHDKMYTRIKADEETINNF